MLLWQKINYFSVMNNKNNEKKINFSNPLGGGGRSPLSPPYGSATGLSEARLTEARSSACARASVRHERR